MREFNGEALNFNRQMRLDRAVDQLIDICSGIVAESVINTKVLVLLRTWMSEHREVCQSFPGNQIAHRVEIVMDDGVITTEEHLDLLETLQQISGNRFIEAGAADPERSAIPTDVDPVITFDGKRYCFTGKFAFGPRGRCEDAVTTRGAISDKNVTQDLDYLVIGALVSKDWKHETYGQKIERALEIRERTQIRPVILSEEQWIVVVETS